MINKKDVLIDGSNYRISLSKLIGKRVIDASGYVSGEFGFSVFKICDLIFEDGTSISIDGDHDIAYIPQDSDKNMPNNMDEETLDYLAES